MTRPECHNALIVFLTEHERLDLDAARQVLKLAHAMALSGYRSAVLNVGRGLARPDWLTAPYLSLDSPERVRSVLERHERRIVIGTSLATSWLAADDSVRSGSPSYHWLDHFPSSSSDGPLDVLLFPRSVRRSHTLTCSPWIRDGLADFGVSGVTLLPAPVDSALLKVERTDPDYATVLCASSVSHPEADARAAKVFEALKKKRVTMRPAVISFMPPANALRNAFAQPLDWFGEDACEKRRRYAKAGCFISTRTDTGLPIPVLEAMAAGCPVVATRSMPMEALCTDGVDILLVEPGDVDGMAEAILRVLRDAELASALGTAARRTMRSNAWEDILAALPAEMQTERRPDRGHGLDPVKWDAA